MPSFYGDKGGLLWDATALSNAFICEYMPTAPEGYVKVYLYGLMCAHAVTEDGGQNIGEMAKALSMEEAEVLSAFRYWERCRLVRRVQDHPPAFLYSNPAQALTGRQSTPQDEEYMAFAQALFAIFGEKRKLHGNETILAYEWVEQLGLPSEVVLMLVQHLVSTRGVQFGFKEAQKLALELCEKKIATIDAAEKLFSRSESARKGTLKVLRHIGKYREATTDETDLYIKWTTEWGFAPKAIEAACSEMTAGDPSFKYLDKILEGLLERGGRKNTSAAQVEKQLAAEKEETGRIREMLSACGLKAAVVDEGKRLVYREMLRCGSHDVVMLAAQAVGNRRGGHSLDAVNELLSAWQEKGLRTAADVHAHLESVQRQNRLIKDLYQSAGRNAAPTLADREILAKWQDEWHLDQSVLSRAAEYACHTEKPFLFMDKMLQGWREAGVCTVAQAESEYARRREALSSERAKTPVASGKSGGKKVLEQQYAQREYDPSEYDGPTAEELEEARKL